MKKKKKRGLWKKDRKKKNRERKGMKRKKRTCESLLLIWVEECLNKHRTFSYVDEESVGRPTPNKLDERRGNAVFHKGSGTIRTHRLAGDVVSEITTNFTDEKRASQNRNFGCEPKWGWEWEFSIAWGQVSPKVVKRVDAIILMFFDNDVIAFKKWVRFVTGEMEHILVVTDNNSWTLCYLFPVTKSNFVGEGELAETHECKETSEQHS